MSAATISSRAREDIIAAVRWIRRDNPTAARAFRDTVQNAAERIGRFPGIGVARPELLPEPYRFLVLRGFPYLIVYSAERQPPLIVRLLHGARDLQNLLRDLA